MELTRFLLVFILCLISRTLAFETKKLSQPLKQDILTLKEPVRESSETRIRHADEEEDEFDIKCGDLPTVHCGHYTGTGHEMGQTWHLQCDPGCHLVGSGEVTCLGVPDPFHHVAIWDHMQGMSKCEKTCCGVPTPPAHGYIVGTNFNLYQNVTVKCDKGYTLKGSDVLQCLPIPYPKACGMWVYVTQWTDSYCVPNPIDTRGDPQYLVSSGGVKETPALETESEDSVCLQPKKTGPCKARMERYYYNNKNKQCEKFIYGGCQRNDNNFKSLEECEDKYIKCGDLPAVHCGHYTGTGHEMGQTRHLQCDPGYHLVGSGEITCLAVPDPFHQVAIWDHLQGISKCEKTCCGVPVPPAHGYIVGTNFNLYQNVTIKCDKGYTLNGSDVLQCLPVPNPKVCGAWIGTDSHCVPNAIDTKRDARYLLSSRGVKETPVLKTESEDSVCLQPKKTGPCKARMERYYYNNKNKQCEKFIYGGCQRNDNNFKTLKECKDKCKN